MRKHTTDGCTATERGKAMVGKLTINCPERRGRMRVPVEGVVRLAPQF